jgi:predicted cupin superfamily sugar epimerase
MLGGGKMQGYNFTERVRKALAFARDEAVRLGHEFVGCEHILLGIIREGSGVANAVLQREGVDGAEVRRRIEEAIQTGRGNTATRDLPYTTRAKKILEFSMAEARELRHSYVGTEHLLLGVLREGKNIAAAVLVDCGLTLDRARAEMLSIPGTDPDGGEPAGSGGPAPAPSARHDAIVKSLGLIPHPEGGHFKELFRSPQRVKEGERDRSAVTTIYYLLDDAGVSRWHVVESDEIWHFYQGGDLLLLDYDPASRKLQQIRLSGTAGAYVHAIPAGHWQAAAATNGLCLMGCTVAPGFEFADFRMVRNIEGHKAHFAGVMEVFANAL